MFCCHPPGLVGLGAALFLVVFIVAGRWSCGIGVGSTFALCGFGSLECEISSLESWECGGVSEVIGNLHFEARWESS